MARILILAAASIFLILGVAHFALTFLTKQLHPRDSALLERMRLVPLVSSSETTMWKAWLGFNATHSVALILFGLVYVYLAGAHFAFLSASPFLLGLGFAVLITVLVLAKLYFSAVRLRGSRLRPCAMPRRCSPFLPADNDPKYERRLRFFCVPEWTDAVEKGAGM